MLKILLISSVLISTNSFSQTLAKSDPDSSINAEEQNHGLPGGKEGKAYSVRTKKRSIKVPSIIAPVENTYPANCADSLNGKGSANYTACEAGKKSR
jgi:hypothetical protein